jgi:FkbM family methyltransferase
VELPYNTHPHFTSWIVEHALLRTKLVIVDVGVQGGIHPRWKALGNCLQVYGFDPLAETIEPLTRLAEPNHEYFAIALGDYDGEGELFVPSILPAASFFPRQAEQDQARMTIDAGNWARTKTRSVPVRRLDTLSQHWPQNIDFLKLDCEGFEPAVLAGASNSIAQALAIETEMGFSSNTVHLRTLMIFLMSTGGSGLFVRRRSGKLLILRLTPRGLRRLRLETTRSLEDFFEHGVMKGTPLPRGEWPRNAGACGG